MSDEDIVATVICQAAEALCFPTVHQAVRASVVRFLQSVVAEICERNQLIWSKQEAQLSRKNQATIWSRKLCNYGSTVKRDD